MAYQMTVTLTDQEYTALVTEATRRGKQPEVFLHDMMLQGFQSSLAVSQAFSEDEFFEQQYREGKMLSIPTRRPLTPEEQDERERLGQLFSGGKPMSEMVIEDRGPL